MAEKPKLSRIISSLLYVQSLALFGIFSMNLLPLFIRKLGSEINPSLVFSNEVTSILIASCLFMTARGVKLCRRRAWILATTEEHSYRGGIGAAVLEAVNAANLNGAIGLIAADQNNLSQIGDQSFLRTANGINVENIIAKFNALVGD